MVFGFLLGGPIQQFLLEQIKQLGQVKEMIDQSDNPALTTFLFIFFNNTLKAIMTIYSGLLLGIFPLFFIIFNGMLVGFVLQLVETEGQNAAAVFMTAIVPHGILEIPAILFVAALGLKLGFLVWRLFLGLFWSAEKQAAKEGLSFYFKSSGTVIGVISVVLLAAALIETFVTVRIIDLFMS